MRALWNAMAVVALLHLFALIGFGVWLNSSGRMSRERLEKVRETFLIPAEEEKAAAEKLAAETAQKSKMAEQMKRESGSSAAMLTGERLSRELTQAAQARLQADVESLQRNLELAQLRLEERQKQLDADRKALEDQQKSLVAQNSDQGFRKAVELYESLPAKQVKDQFLQMLTDMGLATDPFLKVTEYLRAMEPRKAAAVLREFKTPDETAWAVKLMEQLRTPAVQASAQEKTG